MIVEVDRYGPFRLEDQFLEPYHHRPVPWGFGALSWVTFKRTYSRHDESWWQTCRRVIEGMFTVLRSHRLEHRLGWDDAEAQGMAQKAFERMWRFQWTPPGRGLWMMGTRYMYERGGAALNNCGFVSTRDIATDFATPFTWMMDMSMLGVGVGFDTLGAGQVVIQQPVVSDEVHVISDSREGWTESFRRLLAAFTGSDTLPARWDFSRVRPQGAPLEGFGGYASGPEPLQQLLESVEALYRSHIGRRVDSTLIVDTMNLGGRCVVAGGIRRSAQIALGDPNDTAFLDLKLDRERLMEYRWASNNSVLASVGMEYGDIARRTIVNGEPGYFWLENARAYGRMADPPDWRDREAAGCNPCAEQTLWDRELCCLVETFPARHERLDDFLETLRLAYLYAKTVTLVPTHDSRTNTVMEQNRRIGCSMTGIVQAINRHGEKTFFEWCDRAYRFVQELDEQYSRQLAIGRSIKTTSVKPSGSVSILAGATPGVHWEHAPYYLRRVRLSESHSLVAMCREAGYPVEPDRYSERTAVVAFPVHIPYLERSQADVPLAEKVELAVRMQHCWSDNQVSCTAQFDPDREAGEVEAILSRYDRRLKAMVFLPEIRHGYEQPPYETITAERYRELMAGLRPLRGLLGHEIELEERFCEGGVCDLPGDPTLDRNRVGP
ncbi:MAG: hypothetical protein JW797_13510 [Bradymonadales bacterium]|nr:hypothetical protein [Bradymonadales bacterium]